MVFFFLWLTSLSMIISRSIPVAADDTISFFLMAEHYSSVYMYYFFFTHSSFDGHLGCFHVLGVVNCAAMNTGVQVSFQIINMFFSIYIPTSRISRSYGSSICLFLTKLHTILIVAAPVYIISSVGGFPFLHTLSSIYCLLIFWNSHSDQCEVIPHCSFDFNFSTKLWYWASFHMPLGHLYVFFGELSL